MTEPRPEPWYNPEYLVEDRTVVQESTFPKYWTEELADRWSEQKDASEMHETPLVSMDLRDQGYGTFF